MALPVIQINSTTGSDTAASGAGPATAVSGTGASMNATTTVDVSADSPDLSGIATDGSAVLWVDSSSGRQYSKIASVDNDAKTITCESAYANTESSKAWGVGGKRATLNHADTRTLLTDCLPGWTVDIQTDQTLTSTLTFTSLGSTADKVYFISTSTTRPILTFSLGSLTYCLATSGTVYIELRHLALNGAGANSNTIIYSNSLHYYWIKDCEIYGSGTANTSQSGISPAVNDGNARMYVEDCNIHDCFQAGITKSAGGVNQLIVSNCRIHHNTTDGILFNQVKGLTVFNCLIYSNTGDGLDFSGADATYFSGAFIIGNTINGNGGSGINLNATSALRTWIANNNITDNGAFGIAASATSVGLLQAFIDYNNYGSNADGNSSANSSGAVDTTDGLVKGTHDLDVDPGYTDVEDGDFSVGANVKAKGYPDATRKIGGNPTTGTTTYVDIGAAQRQEATPDFPDVGNVTDDDTVNGVTGTFAVPAEADVESGVQYGADGTEFEGELVAGGGTAPPVFVGGHVIRRV